MGFKQGAYAKIWSVEPGESGKYVKSRVSVSRKNKETGVYEQEFSEFVTFIGEANVKARNSLKEGDRIKLGSTDVTTRYDKATKKQFTNFLVFSYGEVEDEPRQAPQAAHPEPGDPDAVEASVEAAAAGPDAEVDTALPF